VEHARVTLGLGCVKLGHPSHGGRRGGARLVHHALDCGVAFFDTADSYGIGASEKVLGTALRGRRDTAVVATKGGYVFQERGATTRALRRLAAPVLDLAVRSPGRVALSSTAGRSYRQQDFSPRYLRSALEASLRRLQTDYVDIYQLHGPPDVCEDEVLGLMAEFKAEGKIRGFGPALEHLDHALDWVGTRAVAHLQVGFGILDPEARQVVIPAAEANAVGVIARGVFASGLVAPNSSADDAWLRPGQLGQRAAVRALAAELGVSPLQLATWFVATTPGVDTLLVGTSSEHHLDEAVRYVRAPSSPEVRDRLVELVGASEGSNGTARPS